MFRKSCAIALLAAAAAWAAVPTPKSYFGHEMGEDKTVLDWEKVAGYFQQLAKSSDRLKVEDLGKTGDGPPFTAAGAPNKRDPGATRKMLETLRFGQVEIGRGADGSAVIPMQQ